MADEKHLEILRRGTTAWNESRTGPKRSIKRPDLSHADLRDTDLRVVNLSNADLSKADLRGANLGGADLSRANLSGADLSRANLSGANLGRANFHGANLHGARLRRADLRAADLRLTDLGSAYLRGAYLRDVDLSGTNLHAADLVHTVFLDTLLEGVRLNKAVLLETSFINTDLRAVKGLETVRHLGPSEIGISTIYKSEGKIPEKFLLGCGVPESFIAQIPALVGAVQPIQFHSCFISYSSKDDEFARRLHSRMREVSLRVWFAPEDMKGGDYFSDQIDRAIQVHDRLLLVLSENSMSSNWVVREIKRARKVEEREGRKKLFPISLTRYEALRSWECLDHDSGLDLAEVVRRYHIPDFSNWKSHDDFEKAFTKLLNDLKQSAEP